MFEQREPFETISAAQQEKICVSLYFCINWIRQLINSFVTEEGKETGNFQVFLCQRLLQAMVLQRQLSRYIKKSPRCAAAILKPLGVVLNTPLPILEPDDDTD